MPKNNFLKKNNPILDHGFLLIRESISKITTKPGVYFMKNKNGNFLYIGKAKNLRKRISSYSNLNKLNPRIKKMISETFSIDYTVTDHEASALLLEANMIKEKKPKFNILMRDDKTYPHILIRKDHEWAQIIKTRGKKTNIGDYFGPFASAGAVNKTLNAMQRIFPLRTCNDFELKNRNRPCLQHQIKRCSAPCVKYITKSKYQNIVNEAKSFLLGKNKNLQPRLEKLMELSSKNLNYEDAAINRDKIRALNIIQSAEGADLRNIKDADVFSILNEDKTHDFKQINSQKTIFAIQVFFFRSGKNFGNRTHFIHHDIKSTLNEILGSFITQFYNLQVPPNKILVNVIPEDKDLIEKAFLFKFKKKIKIHKPTRGEGYKAIQLGLRNSEQALARKKTESISHLTALQELAKTLSIKKMPKRIEIYDNSHFSGSYMTGAMVVYTQSGFQKNQYRKFNLKNISANPHDDYQMISEVIERRFKRLGNKADDSFNKRPDLIIIDGGLGQCTAATNILKKNKIKDISLIGIAKGKKRNSGNEKIYFPNDKDYTPKLLNELKNRSNPLVLSKFDKTLYFLQRLRDEAHRFAIMSQRNRNKKSFKSSSLDQINGVGPKKRKALILRFGSTKKVSEASIKELCKTTGINDVLATQIFNFFNG